jgi:hypothetical protein
MTNTASRTLASRFRLGDFRSTAPGWVGLALLAMVLSLPAGCSHRSGGGDIPALDATPAQLRASRERFRAGLLRGIELGPGQAVEVDATLEAYFTEVDDWREANAPEIRRIRAEADQARDEGDRVRLALLARDARAVNATRPDPEPYLDQIRVALRPDQASRFDANVDALRAELREAAGRDR